MATYVLWLPEHLLRLLLVVVLFRKKAFHTYPVFFTYSSWVLLVGLSRMYIYSSRLELYLGAYWYTEFLSVALGYAVLWEIYGQTLERYPGTSKMTGYVVMGLFLGALILAVVNAFGYEARALIRSVIAFERNVRAIQAVLLTCLLVFAWHYAISLRRDLRGLILGYGLLVSMNVVTLTLRSYLGVPFQVWWQYLQSTSDWITLMMWIIAFWVYKPSAEPDSPIVTEGEYAILAERTSRSMARAWRSILGMF